MVIAPEDLRDKPSFLQSDTKSGLAIFIDLSAWEENNHHTFRDAPYSLFLRCLSICFWSYSASVYMKQSTGQLFKICSALQTGWWNYTAWYAGAQVPTFGGKVIWPEGNVKV